MFILKRSIVAVFLYSLVFTALPASRPVAAQDFVESNSLAGGGSAFVFRGSKSRPQAAAGIGYASSGEGAGGAGRARRTRTNAQIAAAAKKRKAAAALARKKAIIAAANKKIQLSNTLTAKAEKSMDADMTDAAITDYRAALVQNPKNTRASNGLSDALTDKGVVIAGETNSSAAIPLFDEAIKLDPKNDVAYARLGAVYDTAGQKDKAVANYEKAIAINPELAELQGTLGLAYIENGDIAKAEAALAKTGSADTVDIRTLKALVLFKQNKNQEALAAFDKLLEMDQRNVAAHYYRGQVYTRMDNNSSAIAAYKKALEIEPNYAPANYEIGVIQYNSGKYNDAVASYQAVTAADPKNYQAHANLASSYRQLERYADANA
ncbi:MAG TPA: tetratricopeptide repeat protein, partial [Pyrinomonadaceae bacterium]|nr:tetratricopeptide repeat protein [Pyrinomonadaceae bacterium]